MRVRFTRTALRHLDEIFSYIARENPVAADRVVRRIEAIAAALGVPFIGATAA